MAGTLIARLSSLGFNGYMLSFLSILIFIFCANLVLGTLVLFKNPKKQINRSFFLLVLFTDLWILFNHLADNDQSNLLLWNRLTFTAIILLAPTFTYFGLVFRSNELDNKHILLLWFFLIPLLFALLSIFTKTIVEDVMVGEMTTDLTYGFGYPFFVSYFVIYIFTGLTIFIKQYRNAVGNKKEQIRFLLFGMSMSILLATITNLVYPIITGKHDLSKFGPLAVSFLIIASTYAIVRHRLMDVRLAVRELILHLFQFVFLGLIILAIIYPFFINWIEASRINIFSVAFIAAILIGSLSRTLDKGLRNVTDKFLFQKEYNRRELLQNLGKVISQSIKLGELEDQLISTLKDALRPDSIAIKLKDEVDSSMWNFLNTKRNVIVLDELQHDVENKETENKPILEEIIQIMHDKNIAVAVPLIATEGVVAIILLGEKKGGGVYTSNDLEALETLMYQAGVAAENAALFEEVQQFNKKLQAEVASATTNLKVRNKRLTILRQLDQIILNTPNISDMTQKIADLISWDMGFLGAAIVLLEEDDAGKYLRIASVSATPLLERAVKSLPQPINEYRFNWGVDPSNLFYKSITERKAYYTDSFQNMYVPPLTIEQARKLQEISKTQHTIIYPLSTKGNALGAIGFSVYQNLDNLSQDDRELIEAFMDEAGIAIENAQLYTKLEKSNAELLHANERLKQLDRMKDELVSVASHELRTPMTAIKSYLWMALNKEAPHLTDNLKRYLERAFISSERMIDLVNDMLSASRLEGGRIELDLRACDVMPIIQDVIEQLQPKAAEKELKLTFVKPKTDLPLAKIDEPRFREIMFNLIGNSVKYTDNGSINVKLSEHENAIGNINGNNSETANYLWIAIEDTGRGIIAEDMPRLFKKFGKLEQGSFTKTAETGGTGLGLYITKGLVELHGGRIWVESKGENKGSVFTFSVCTA